MPKKFTIFRASLGLNNKVDPVRLKYDPETGVQELAEAVNVDIDQTGRISRRKGYLQRRSDVAHSLWSNGDLCFYVSGTALYRLNKDWTRTGIRSGLTPEAPMSFRDAWNDVYYCNGYENGMIRDGVSYPWVGEAYSGPTTKWSISTIPPVGHLLELIGGYMLIAQNDVIWPSMQFAYSWYRLSRDRFQFEGKITMMKAIEDGLWVSDSKGIYWLEGLDPQQWRRVPKANYPAVAGTAVVVNGSRVGAGNLPGLAVIWASTKGLCIGGQQGYFTNLTERKLIYPSVGQGAGIILEDRFVCSLS